MNKGFFLGNLTADPISRTTPSGKTACNFTVAVSSGWGENKKTDFIQVAAWGALGENCQKYLTKGKKVLAIGTVGQNTYTTKNGEQRAAITLTANEIEFLSPSGSHAGSANSTGNGGEQAQGYQRGDMMKAQGGEAPEATQTQGFTDITNTYEGEFPF